MHGFIILYRNILTSVSANAFEVAVLAKQEGDKVRLFFQKLFKI